jgi:hypothetical protein
MEYADPCGVGDSIRATNNVKLLQQRRYVILAGLGGLAGEPRAASI